MTARLTALRASLVADALCLGPHWVYNQSKLARTYPEGVHHYDDPQSTYHPNRSAGQFTHYGDQTLALLRSLALRRGWDRLRALPQMRVLVSGGRRFTRCSNPCSSWARM